MRKMVRLIVSAVLCLSLAVSAFAAEVFTPSVSYKDTPDIVPIRDEQGETAVAVIRLNSGTPVSYLNPEGLVITSVMDAKNAQRDITEAENFLLSVYQSVETCLVSDLPVDSLKAMLKRYEGYAIQEILSLEGKTVLGDAFYEFYPDEEKLEALTLRLFYTLK